MTERNEDEVLGQFHSDLLELAGEVLDEDEANPVLVIGVLLLTGVYVSEWGGFERDKLFDCLDAAIEHFDQISDKAAERDLTPGQPRADSPWRAKS